MLPRIGKEMPLSEHAYFVIKDAILNNRIKPKEILSEEALAAQLGISRTPLRTALKKLEFEKLVIINSAKNTVVADVAKEDMEKVSVIRLALEPVAARIACGLITEEQLAELESVVNSEAEAVAANDLVKFVNSEWNFHTLIAYYSQNEILYEMVERVIVFVQRFLTLSTTMPKYARVALEEHRIILEALKARDSVLAEEKMTFHVRKVFERLNEG